MKKKLLIAAILLVGSAAAVLKAGEIAALYTQQQKEHPTKENIVPYRDNDQPADRKITEIAIERTACLGTCPEYSAVIKSDGTVRYHGEAFVSRKGDFTGKVNLWRFNMLTRFIRESEFDQLDAGYTATVTDNPTVYTSVVMNGQRKTVKDYAHAGPAKLWAIEELIDSLIATTEWNGPATTQPSK
jgi:hypothetical protein